MVDWAARNRMRSQAVLIGTSTYDCLPHIPAAANSLNKMHQLLISDLCHWNESHVRVIENPSEPTGLASQLLDAYETAQDVALFYYVGHGQRDDENKLCLGLTKSQTSDGPHIASTSLEFDVVKRALRASMAAVKIIILDCCKSGVSASEGDLARAAGGAYIVAATKEYGPARFNTERGGLTYFTRHFVSVIEQGIANDSEDLTLDAIVSQVRRSLSAANLPLPTDIRQDLHGYAFARNEAFQPQSHSVSGRTWYLYDAPPPPHRGEITSVAFNSTGDLLATGGVDGAVVIQKVSLDAKCSMTARLGETHDERVAYMRQSKAIRGAFDSLSGERKSIKDLLGDEILTRLATRKLTVTGLAFKPNETELAMSGGIRGVSFWPQTKNKPINVGVARSRCILPVYSSTGASLVSTEQPLWSSTSWLLWWDFRALPTYFIDALGAISAIASSPHAEDIFACGYRNGIVRLWSFKTCKTIGPVIQDEVGNPVRSLKFSPDGLSLAVVNQDGLVSLWSVTGAKEQASFADLAEHTSEEEACFLPVERRLVGESAGVCSIAYSPNGVWLATGHEDGCIRLWDPITAHEVEQSLVHSSRDVVAKETMRRVTGLIFSPDSKLLVAVNENGQMFIWRTVFEQSRSTTTRNGC